MGQIHHWATHKSHPNGLNCNWNFDNYVGDPQMGHSHDPLTLMYMTIISQWHGPLALTTGLVINRVFTNSGPRWLKSRRCIHGILISFNFKSVSFLPSWAAFLHLSRSLCVRAHLVTKIPSTWTKRAQQHVWPLLDCLYPELSKQSHNQLKFHAERSQP